MKSYQELKSGTDIRGIASDLGGKPIQLTDEAVERITAAFVVWLVDKTGKTAENLTISLGHDSRITAERISAAVTRALTRVGVTLFDCGLSSTPAMFMTTLKLHADAAVQITASHHPFDRNGLKFFTKDGGLNSEDIAEIVILADQGAQAPASRGGTVSKVDFMKEYAKDLRALICESVGKKEEEQPLRGFHIVVDAGNGAGGFYAEDVLRPLGADITGSQFLEPDGMFPNHVPNPENEQAMESICKAVTEHHADLGLIFDTDVDRAGCVDKSGAEINRNRLIALAAAIAMQGNEGATIVTDSVTSDGLKEFIETDLGGKHYRYKRGYKNVINKAMELCEQGINCPLAIETSGHAALRENYFLDDGAYLVTKIVIELAKGRDLDRVLKSLKMPAEEREYRFTIQAEDFKAYGERVIRELEAFCGKESEFRIAEDNREGLRVSTPHGWFLLRLSVHDPVMPINMESDEIGGIQKMTAKLVPFFEKQTLLSKAGFAE